MKSVIWAFILSAWTGSGVAAEWLMGTFITTNDRYRWTAYYPSKSHHQQVFIDADGDPATGYPIAGIGADYLIEDDRFYHHEGGGWNWDFVAEAPSRLLDKRLQKFMYWEISQDKLALSAEARAVFAGADETWEWVEVGQPVSLYQPQWRPAPEDRWQWQLTGEIDETAEVEIFDLDLFDTSAAQIAALHRDGKKVVCYFSAGTYEDWRPDADRFPMRLLGEALDDWEGEWWLDIRKFQTLGKIMAARLDLARRKGCDGVEPDNVDAYENDSGFQLGRHHQLRYNYLLAYLAHERGLPLALKNTLALTGKLEPYFDWALNESCFRYEECKRLEPFLKAGKAVWGVSYVNRRGKGARRAVQVCPRAERAGFLWQIKTRDLDAWRIDCGEFSSR